MLGDPEIKLGGYQSINVKKITYEKLRQMAFDERLYLSTLVEKIVDDYESNLGRKKPKKV